LLDEHHPVGHAGAGGVESGVGDALGVEIDAHAAGAVVQRGGDDDLALAAAQVIHDVAGTHLCGLEHDRDDLGRARDPDDIQLGRRASGRGPARRG